MSRVNFGAKPVMYVLVAAMFVLIAARFLQRIVYLMKKGEDET